MLTASIQIALTLLAAAMVLNVYRLVRGPDLADRIIAVDTLYINTAAMLILYGVRLNTDRYYEAALLIAMLGFLSTVALAKYLARGNIID